MQQENIVEMKNVSIEYQLKKYSIRAITDCTLDIKRNCITGLVGESGSGKTTLATSVIDCISSPGKLVAGDITFYGADSTWQIAQMSEKEKQAFRWKEVSMVFQAAQSALNPIMTIWEHFWETYRAHDAKVTKEVALQRAKDLLEYVKLDADRVLQCYPHELSGGMKQRVMIAFSLLLHPEMIILDEPTTALDVITQSYIFNFLQDINKSQNISMLLMTHDINVVAKFSDYVAVMYAGRIMEYGKTSEVFSSPKHPYTQGLLNATPSLSRPIDQLQSIPGNPPDMRNLPEGCPFCNRCAYATEECHCQDVETAILPDGRKVRCIHPL